MSDALWPVFEDGHKHSLCDEGTSVLRASDDLDAMAAAAGHMPLSAFDEHANVPTDVVAQLAEKAHDVPDLSGFPVLWHDPSAAVATLDAILSALRSQGSADVGGEDPAELAECLEAFRRTLQQAAARQTRFNFTIA